MITRSLGPEVEIEVDVEGPLAVELGDVFLLCSDGLSGPVEDNELGVFAGNFHPRDACRYLVNLANLRGGLDNITVVIVRIGAWIDPDSTEVHHQPDSKTGVEDRFRDGWRKRLTGLLKSRKSTTPAVVEDHPYRTYACPIDEDLIAKLHDLTRVAQEKAIEQAWSIDWTMLASLRRQETEARAAKNAWITLRKLGEIISLLGLGLRFHRKSGNSHDAH